jgi:hypothetical protein
MPDSIRPGAERSYGHLREAGLTASDVAHATGASTRTTRRWLTGQTEPQARYLAPLDDLSTVVNKIRSSLTPRGVHQWLRARNRLLDAQRPLDMLRAGEFDKVHAAAAAWSEGVYV